MPCLVVTRVKYVFSVPRSDARRSALIVVQDISTLSIDAAKSPSTALCNLDSATTHTSVKPGCSLCVRYVWRNKGDQ